MVRPTEPSMKMFFPPIITSGPRPWETTLASLLSYQPSPYQVIFIPHSSGYNKKKFIEDYMDTDGADSAMAIDGTSNYDKKSFLDRYNDVQLPPLRVLFINSPYGFDYYALNSIKDGHIVVYGQAIPLWRNSLHVVVFHPASVDLNKFTLPRYLFINQDGSIDRIKWDRVPPENAIKADELFS
jgi:hypothetical protein